jgi:hypothetical protein
MYLQPCEMFDQLWWIGFFMIVLFDKIKSKLSTFKYCEIELRDPNLV